MKKYFLPAAIILVAAFFRLYRLNELPPGLHYDEAFNATMAQRVLAGVERPLYFTEDLTEEPMAIYTAALFFWLFGASAYSLRLVSAFVGILTVAAIYYCARSFATFHFRDGGWGLGLLSASILAILYWHINFSRLGMEPIFLPLMLTFAIAFLMRGLKRELKSNPPDLVNSSQKSPSSYVTRHTSLILAGLFLALTLYTYKAALFVPIFIGAFLISEIIFNRAFLRQNARGLAVFLAAAVLVFAPLGLYWATHPGEFIERPSTVLATPATYIQNALQVGAMLFLHGDENPRSNLPGRAALDPLLAIGFIIGITICLARFRHRAPRLLLIWLGVMVLPSVLTDFAPHFGRSIAVTPTIALITAYGFATLVERIRFRLLVYSFLLFALAFGAVSTFNDYFNIWAESTGKFESFDVGLLSLAQKLRARPPNETLFLTPVERDHYTIQFGLQGADAKSFNGSYALVLPESGSAGAYGIVTRSDPRTLTRLQKVFPSGRAVETIYDFAGQPYAVIFRVEGTGQPLPSKRVNARLGEQIALLGYDAVRTGNDIALTLYWGSLAEARADYTVFVHLLESSGRVIAQDDAQPGHRSYPTSRWRAGQVVLDDYHLVVPPGARDELKIEIGMYVLDTGARLRVTDVNGAPMENDRVLIERFTLP